MNSWPKQLSLPRVVVLVALAAALTAGLLGFSGVASASQEPRVVLESTSAQVGKEVVLTLTAENMRNLAGFQSKVNYDGAALKLEYAELQQGLEASGRDMMELGPVSSDGSLVLGAATCPASSCTASEPWRATKKVAGVDGDVSLATLTFTPQQPGDYQISLADVTLVDPQGNVLTATTVNAVVRVSN